MRTLLRVLGIGAVIGLFTGTLACFLVGLAGETETETPPPAHSPPRHPHLSQVETENLLRSWLADWAWDFTVREITRPQGALDCGNHRPGRFANEWESGTTDFRLFVLGYPDVAEGWARRAAGNPASPGWERARALQALGYLAEAGRGTAETALADLCRDSDGHFRRYALLWLCRADRRGAHRTLYKESARQGDWGAVEALGFWSDPEACEILEQILSRPSGIIQGYAKESLTRVEALASEDWHPLAKKAILGEEGRLGSRHSWALRVAKERSAPWLETILRLRLDSAGASTLLRLIPPHLTVEEDGVDDALLALAEIGGTLTVPEQRYLRHYGYGCEPRQRLAEVLAGRSLIR